MAMDVDQEGEEAQDAREVTDYGIEPDFEQLGEDEKEVSVMIEGQL
jgi:hypothetical protein